MGLFQKINKVAAESRKAEEALYLLALQELASGDIRPGLWAKSFADSGGDENRTRATYLKRRVQQIRDELATLDRVMDRLSTEWDGESTTAAGVKSPASEAGAQSSAAHRQREDATARQPAPSPPLSDEALEGLAASRTGNAPAWVIAGSVLALIGLSTVLQSGPGTTASPTRSESTAATGAVVAEVRRLIDANRPWEAYALANKTSSQQLRDEAWAAIRETSPTASGPSAQHPRVVFATSQPHSLIPDEAEAVSTVAGTLAIVPAPQSVGSRRVELNGRPLGLANDHMYLLSISRHGSQDIVLVASQCGGTACGYLDLAFVRVRAGTEPVIERQEDLRFPSDRTDRLKDGISVRGDSTEVALGVDRGSFVFASIGPASALDISRQSAPIERLSRDDCSVATQMLEFCAELESPCSDAPFNEFPQNCPGASMPLYRTTEYLGRHTTGLNLPAFARACGVASELGMAPSADFVTTEICAGADPKQWDADR